MSATEPLKAIEIAMRRYLDAHDAFEAAGEAFRQELDRIADEEEADV